MAIATFSDLVAAVANWLHRTDLAGVIPDFVTLAEARIYQGSPAGGVAPLRLMAMETQVSGNTSAGIGTLTDVLQMRRVTMGSGLHARDLDYVPLHEMTRLQRQIGQPSAYTFDAGSIVVGPVPDADYDFVITYFKRFPALSAQQQTNWLLSNAPNVYLYGTLLESMPYIRDDARTALWLQAYVDAVAAVQTADDQARTAAGSLVMRAA